MLNNRLRSKLIIVAGTYEGVLAGWERVPDEEEENSQSASLNLVFATPAHEGSIRSLCLASSESDSPSPGTVLSCGYDEMLKTHDWRRHLTCSGEIRGPADFGTPTCSSFAPPTQAPSTHCILGFSAGRLVLYKKRDWSIQHILAGHEGGVASLAVHPSGKMALSGGTSDGKLKLWDLTKGRLAYVTKIPSSSSSSSSYKRHTRHDSICSIVWSHDGSLYAYAHASHITVRDVATGKPLLDVDLPGRVNQISIMAGQEGTFVAAACNDGSLPVLALRNVDGEDDTNTRRAILAIEPVDSPAAGEERFKCIQSIDGYTVVTANSAGVVSVMNLEGAVRMIMTEDHDQDKRHSETSSDDENDDDDDDDDDDGEEELAVEIMESARLGTGARITCLAAWNRPETLEAAKTVEDGLPDKVIASINEHESVRQGKKVGMKRKRGSGKGSMEMNAEAVERARVLVGQAKKLKRREDKKKTKRKKRSK